MKKESGGYRRNVAIGCKKSGFRIVSLLSVVLPNICRGREYSHTRSSRPVSRANTSRGADSRTRKRDRCVRVNAACVVVLTSNTQPPTSFRQTLVVCGAADSRVETSAASLPASAGLWPAQAQFRLRNPSTRPCLTLICLNTSRPGASRSTL
jgi:hypothetical protein